MTLLQTIKEKGWRSLEAKKSNDKKASCWVSPNGEWYNCGFAGHPIFAKYVIKELYPSQMPEDTEGCNLVLIKIGWIAVYDDPFTGTIVRLQKMSEKQFKTLYAFFGDEPLFRFNTIRSLYNQYGRSI